MPETDLSPEEASADVTIPLYNGGAYDPVTNPRGFDEDGHTVNLMPLANHVRVMGRLARRMALFVVGLKDDVIALKSDVIGLKALTAEDASNTGQDRIATSQYVTAAAGEVTKAANWAGAAENTPVEAGRFSALHWAMKAAASAAGVNLPPINSGEGGRYLQAKSDRSGFQLTALPFATQGEIDAGTGTGIVRADRLGVRLASMQTGIDAAAAVVPPVGAILATSRFAVPPPAAKWQPADGRKLVRSAYPELAAALLDVPEGYGVGAPLYATANQFLNIGIGGTAGPNGPVLAIVKAPDGRILVVQSGYARIVGAAGGNVNAWANSFSLTRVEEAQRQMVALRVSEVIYIDSSGNIRSNPIGSGGEATLLAGVGGGYASLHQFDNGTILAFYAPTNSDTYRCVRLRANQSAVGGFSVMNPAGSEFHSVNHLLWTDKAGYLYLLWRASSAATTYSIHRTLDGEAWTQVASGLPLGSAPSWFSDRAQRNTKSAYRNQDEGRYISNDGQRIVIRVGAREFLVSTNGGATWIIRNSEHIAPGLTYDSSSTPITCCYDPWEDDFVLAFHHVVSATSRLTIVRTTNFGSFTVTMSTVFLQGGVAVTNPQILPLRSRGLLLTRRVSTSNYRTRITTSSAIATDQNINYDAVMKVVGYPCDGYVLFERGGSYYQFVSFDGDGIYDFYVASSRNTPIDGVISNDGKISVTADSATLTAGYNFNYDPTTEIKLPRIVHEFSAISQSAQTSFYDAMRASAFAYVGLNYYIRVK